MSEKHSPELSREVLPHWEPCNPGCDPEFNGERTAYCGHLCKGAREALHAAALVRSVPVGEVKPVAWCDERAIQWLADHPRAAGITAKLTASKSIGRPTPLYTAPPAPPEGMVMVPVEPTPEMLEAMSEVDATPDKILRLIYKSGIAAAPQPGDKP